MRRYDILSSKAKSGAELYRLVFTIKAFADFEELAGVPLYAVEMDKIKPSDIEAMMLLALQDQQPAATHKQARQLLAIHGQHGHLKLFNSIKRAVGVAPDGDSASEVPADFWSDVSNMVALLGIAPWEAERFTFNELRQRAVALDKINRQQLELVAWHATLMINIQLPRDKQITVNDLLGTNKPKKEETPREALERVRREIAESEATHA